MFSRRRSLRERMGIMGKRKTDATDTIHVLYALTDTDGKYSKFAGTSICSLFENTHSKVHVHVFQDGTIRGDNEEKFRLLAQQYHQDITFYNLKKSLAPLWGKAREIYAEAVDSARYTEAALYRLVAHDVLPKEIHRLIYLDADTLVHLDIRELWEEALGESGMGGITEADMLEVYGLFPEGAPQEPVYLRMMSLGLNMQNCFNSGVLLMDLDKLRQKGDILLSGLRFIGQYPGENKFFDQNILNYHFAVNLTHLNRKYNILVHWDRQHIPQIKEAVQGIYHYMGHSLGMNGFDARDTLFYDYFLKTPWGNGELFCRINGVMKQVYLKFVGPNLTKMQKLVVALSSRHPVFAVSKECEDEFKKTDTIRYLSLGSEKEGLDLTLPYDIEHHMYLLFLKDYNKVRIQLSASGLEEGVHFADGMFLTQGEPWLEKLIDPYLFFSML